MTIFSQNWQLIAYRYNEISNLLQTRDHLFTNNFCCYALNSPSDFETLVCIDVQTRKSRKNSHKFSENDLWHYSVINGAFKRLANIEMRYLETWTQQSYILVCWDIQLLTKQWLMHCYDVVSNIVTDKLAYGR